jgi:hypothetical protein
MSGDDIVSLRAAVEAGTQGVLGPLDHLQCGKVIATLRSSRLEELPNHPKYLVISL